jgi:hypothetical protein
MEPIDTFEHAGLTVELYYDEGGMDNPLVERDEVGKRVGWGDHSYNGHVPDGFEEIAEPELEIDVSDDFEREDWQARTLEQALGADHDVELVVLLDWASNNHGSGTASLDVTDDAERANLAWMFTADELLGQFSGDPAMARSYVEANAEEFAHWYNGEVYGYVVKDEDGGTLDSCWGFIGDVWSEDIGGVRHEGLSSANWQRTLIEREQAEAFHWACADVVTVGSLAQSHETSIRL